jgi:hypothetical protein
VVKAIKSASYAEVRRPAGGLVVIDFANTAAQGARIVAQERGKAPAARVGRTEDGRPRISAKTLGGEVAVTITGEGETSAAAVASLHRAVQARIGTLLDARRRAARRASPAGKVVIAFRVTPRGIAKGRRVSSTIADKNTPGRVIKALRAAARGEKGAAGSYRIAVTFAER